jgi:hypothetical protein
MGAIVILAGVHSLAAEIPPSSGSESAPAASSIAPPAAEARQPPVQPAPEPHPPENLEALAPDAGVAILGKKVRDASGHDMGLVVDVVVNREGIPLAAVIDFGGFLGVGDRKIAIDWALLQFKPDDHDAPVVLALNRAQVQAAPEFKPTAQQRAQIVGPPPTQGDSSPSGTK